MSEVFPPTGLEFPDACAFGDPDTFRGARDFADAFDSDAVDSARQARHVGGFDREKQLEIFTAMQRQLQRIQRSAATQLDHCFVNRQLRRVDQGTNAARRA